MTSAFGGRQDNNLSGGALEYALPPMSLETLSAPADQLQWTLVGNGSKTKNCGRLAQVLSCQSCMQPYYVRHRCLQKLCPSCYETWHRKAAAKVKVRLTSNRAETKNEKKQRKHLMLSSCRDLYSLPIQKLREKAEEYLYSISNMYVYKRSDGSHPLPLTQWSFERRKKGFSITRKCWDRLSEGQKEQIYKAYKVITSAPSGVLIFHPFRLNQKGKYLYHLARKEAQTKLGDPRHCQDEKHGVDPDDEDDGWKTKPLNKWEWVRAQANPMELIEFSPHFHFVGWTSWLDPPEKNGEFVYKVIMKGKDEDDGDDEEPEAKNQKHVAILGSKDVYRVVFYLLSHVGVPKNFPYYPGYVYLGNVSDRCGSSIEERNLAENGFHLCDDDVVVHTENLKLERTMADATKKGTCHWCRKHGTQGKLFWIGPNLLGFFRAHLIPYDELDPNWIEISEMVTKCVCPDYIKLHVLQQIDFKLDGKPPDDVEDYVIRVEDGPLLR
jgi:hypothetical protein